MEDLRSRIGPNEKKSIVFMGESHFIPAFCVLHRNITLSIPDSSAVKMSQK